MYTAIHIHIYGVVSPVQYHIFELACATEFLSCLGALGSSYFSALLWWPTTLETAHNNATAGAPLCSRCHANLPSSLRLALYKWRWNTATKPRGNFTKDGFIFHLAYHVRPQDCFFGRLAFSSHLCFRLQSPFRRMGLPLKYTTV